MDRCKQIIRGKFWLYLLALCLLSPGCGQFGSGSDQPGPDAVMAQFLTAIRDEQHDAAAALLTPQARAKTAEMQMVLAPSSSDSASFKVLAQEIEGDEAQVGTDWTDLDENGRPQTSRIVWLLRRNAEGWRVAGMATRVFDDQEPVVLNFEDPADMVRKQQSVAAEMARREGDEPGQPQASKQPAVR